MPMIITINAGIYYNEHFKAGAKSRFDDLLSELAGRAAFFNAEPAWGTLKLSTSVNLLDTSAIAEPVEVVEEIVTWYGEVQAVVNDDA